MEQFKKNSNKLNGITIRQSDMSFELKNQITKVIFQASQNPNKDQKDLSERITQYLNNKDPDGWICLIGKKFMANISHQPKHFIRLSNDNYNFLIYKCE